MERLDGTRLAAEWHHSAERHADRLHTLERELALSNPMGVLERGYSITMDAKGQVIRSVSAVKEGQVLQTRMTDGSFQSTVEARAFHTRQARDSVEIPPRRTRQSRDRAQLPLFAANEPS